jgi:phenylacetate-CoA ligase
MNVIAITDFLSRKNVTDYYKEYVKTQWYSKDEMLNFQWLKFQKLVEHCYHNVPYYRNYMNEKGFLPTDIHSVSDVSLFPVLTKEIIQSNYSGFIPININKIKNVKISQTGGTTGNILIKRTDANVRSSTWATFKRFYDWMGIGDRDVKLRLMGGHVLKHSIIDDIKSKVNGALLNIISINPYDNSDENIDKIIKTLNKNDIKLIKGYSQGLYYIASLFRDKGLKFNVESVTTTAEPLMPEHRLLFKEIFNAESFDQYGCGEVGGIAYECSQHEGLHVSEERVILEFNESNDLLITDLDNYTMPYIRYWNADQAIPSGKKCSCGRQSLMLEKILGRTCDYLTGMDGKELHWAYFWHLLFDTKIAVSRNIKKFQVNQVSKDKILFRTVSDPLKTEDKEILEKCIQEKLGNISIEFKEETDIENAPSGKFRPVINQIKK